MLCITIPKGSLEDGTFNLFEKADLPIRRKSSRDYRLYINDPRIKEAMMLRPQEIPKYVEEGEFDLGITGLDWITETKSAVKEVADLQFSKQGWGKIKIVLATSEDNPVSAVEEIAANARVVTEYPRMTKRFLKGHNKGRISVRGSYGATEVKVPRLADYLVDVTETGESLRQNRKKIIAVIMESSTKLIANIESWNDPEKRKAIKEIASLLQGVIRSRDKVLIKMNITKGNLQQLVGYLPALRPPVVSSFYSCSYPSEEEWVMVETVVKKSALNIILPEIKGFGAKDILELDISKMIP